MRTRFHTHTTTRTPTFCLVPSRFVAVTHFTVGFPTLHYLLPPRFVAVAFTLLGPTPFTLILFCCWLPVGSPHLTHWLRLVVYLVGIRWLVPVGTFIFVTHFTFPTALPAGLLPFHTYHCGSLRWLVWFPTFTVPHHTLPLPHVVALPVPHHVPQFTLRLFLWLVMRYSFCVRFPGRWLVGLRLRLPHGPVHTPRTHTTTGYHTLPPRTLLRVTGLLRLIQVYPRYLRSHHPAHAHHHHGWLVAFRGSDVDSVPTPHHFTTFPTHHVHPCYHTTPTVYIWLPHHHHGHTHVPGWFTFAVCLHTHCGQLV